MGAFSIWHWIIPGVILVLIPFVRYARARRTNYRFSGGWIIVRSGVLFTTDQSYELTHIVSVEVTQNPIEQLTGNGKLRLDLGNHGKVALFGLASIHELRDIRDKLISVSRMLRSHPTMKGLVA